MNAQNTARGVLRQLVDRAPQARNIEIALMQPYDQEIRLLLAQEVNDCFDRPPLDQMTVEFDAVNSPLGLAPFPEVLYKTSAGPPSQDARIELSATSAKAVYAGRSPIAVTVSNSALRLLASLIAAANARCDSEIRYRLRRFFETWLPPAAIVYSVPIPSSLLQSHAPRSSWRRG